jgi:hypothetical protein
LLRDWTAFVYNANYGTLSQHGVVP